MPSSASPSENLALAYQEVFTAIERLRSGRQTAPDAATFRRQLLDALQGAEQLARSRGYSAEEIRLASFALVAFLDASVLSLQSPVFRDWARKPLQEELFGSFNAGEIFFTNIQRLMDQPDSASLADLLEVYQLCLLLGFLGRHSLGGASGGTGELKAIRETLAQRIRRIRGAPTELSPAWKPSGGAPRDLTDRWLRPLLWMAIASFVLAILLFIVYKTSLSSGISGLRASLIPTGRAAVIHCDPSGAPLLPALITASPVAPPVLPAVNKVANL